MGGHFCATLNEILNPEVIVFAVEQFEERGYLMHLVERVVKRRTIQSYLPTVRLVRSSLNHRVGLQGMAMLALNRLLEIQTT